MAIRNGVTSERVAKIAARGARNPFGLKYSEVKELCASCLVQARAEKATRKKPAKTRRKR